MRTSIAALVVLLLFPAAAAFGGESLRDEKDKVSYSVGYQVGGDFKRQGLDINAEAMVHGVVDALKEREPQISPEDMRTLLVDLKKKIVAKQRAQNEAAGIKNMEDGKAFLLKNGKKDGVVTTDSGLQYQIIEKGKGESPEPGETVTVHYRGTLVDGTEFDSSYSRGQPATFKSNQVIKGWQEALSLMKPGAKWKLFIPADLAYGPRGAGNKIGPNSTLIFEVELLEVKKGG